MQSFAEIQKAESEEMQRLNKIRAQEIEKQKANQINNKSQVNFSNSDWNPFLIDGFRPVGLA